MLYLGRHSPYICFLDIIVHELIDASLALQVRFKRHVRQ